MRPSDNMASKLWCYGENDMSKVEGSQRALLAKVAELEAENERLQESVKQLERVVDELRALLAVVSHHGSALMALLTPEQIRAALVASRGE